MESKICRGVMAMLAGPLIFSIFFGLTQNPVGAAQYLEPSNAQRSYSAGVVTQGGRIVWLAGMGGTQTADGKKITYFAGQTRRAFENIEAALKQAGGSLDDIVSMTVMIRNQSDGNEFVKIRSEFFKTKFPASTLITAKDFANPDLLVEIQSVAVIGDQLATVEQKQELPRNSANERNVYLIRQDFSDCTNSTVGYSSNVAGTLSVIRGDDGTTTVKVNLTGAPNTTYHFYLKCVRQIGEIRTGPDGSGKATLSFPTNFAGNVYGFDVYPEGAPLGNKFQSVQVQW
jgi:enamine deaminase RidA (YjgF/YER057c/UK114 family)